MRIGILGMLGLIFTTLKLLGVITWSWWLVLLPFYAIPLLLLIAFIGALAVASSEIKR